MTRPSAAGGSSSPPVLWLPPAPDALLGAYYRWLPIHYLTPDLRILRIDESGAPVLLPREETRRRLREGYQATDIDPVVAFARWRPALVLATPEVLAPAIRRRERGGEYWVLPLYSLAGAGFSTAEVAALQGRQWANARYLRGDSRYRIEDAYVDFRRAQPLATTHLAAATQVARLSPDVFAALGIEFARFLAVLS